jgi:hyaluronan synthase
MAGFIFARFRTGSMLGPRINASLSIVRIVSSGLIFLPLIIGLLAEPTLAPWVVLAALVSGLLPAAVFASTRSLPGSLWAFPYAIYSLLCLAWISPWALVTPHHSGWLTRQRPSATERVPLSSH